MLITRTNLQCLCCLFVSVQDFLLTTKEGLAKKFATGLISSETAYWPGLAALASGCSEAWPMAVAAGAVASGLLGTVGLDPYLRELKRIPY